MTIYPIRSVDKWGGFLDRENILSTIWKLARICFLPQWCLTSPNQGLCGYVVRKALHAWIKYGNQLQTPRLPLQGWTKVWCYCIIRPRHYGFELPQKALTGSGRFKSWCLVTLTWFELIGGVTQVFRSTWLAGKRYTQNDFINIAKSRQKGP